VELPADRDMPKVYKLLYLDSCELPWRYLRAFFTFLIVDIK